MRQNELWLHGSRMVMGGFAILLMAASLADVSDQPIETSDKLLHFLAYGLFTGLAYGASRHQRQFMTLCVAIFLYGLLIECLQGLTPYRTLSLADAVANATGIGIIAGFCLLLKKWQRSAS